MALPGDAGSPSTQKNISTVQRRTCQQSQEIMLTRLSLATLLVALPCAALAVPTAVVGQDGSYLGFDNVIVQGTSYSVRFVDGTFNDLFGGVAQFQFASQAGAAANSLRQAIIAVPALDAEPFRMAGCGATGTIACYAMTTDAEFSSLPGEVDVIAVRNGREADSVLNGMEALFQPTDLDSHMDNIGPGGAHSFVWAKWTVSAVPEPTTTVLLAAGLAVIGFRRRAIHQKGWTWSSGAA